MKLARVFQFCFFDLILSTCLSTPKQVDNEGEFSYRENSEFGPSHWGEIHKEWNECGAGKMQSPIDMANQRVQLVSYLGRLKRSYKPANATVINRGHDIMIRWPNEAGYIKINRTLYPLRQIHWHSPAEHTINGRRLDMELHMVHQTNDNRTAVVGIMYKIGRPNSFLYLMEQDLKAVAHEPHVEKTIGFIDPKLIKLGSRKYFRYMGSLTTPPCTQNVIWTISRKVRTVTRGQIAMIRDAICDEAKANARPIQQINDRHWETLNDLRYGSTYLITDEETGLITNDEEAQCLTANVN